MEPNSLEFTQSNLHAPNLLGEITDKRVGLIGFMVASLLGIASPICMYGTIPIVASFARKGMR